MTYPDAVPPLQQFEPVRSGVFDILFTHPAYHAGVSTLGIAIDGTKADPAKRRKSGVFEFVDQHYAKMGLRLVALPLMGSKPFRYYLKKPITGEPALKGRKIRGTVSYHPMIKALGGSPVVMGGGAIYAAMQKSVIDGAAYATLGAKDFKWHEVVDYLVEPEFGSASLIYLANADTWKGLSKEARGAITRAAIRLETKVLPTWTAWPNKRKRT